MRLNKYLFLVLTLGFSISVLAQKKTIEVIDQRTGNPIFGAHFIVKDKIIGVSDDVGMSELDFRTINEKDSICVSHIAYDEKCYALREFVRNTVVELTATRTILDEIIISSNKKEIKKVRSILRNAKKRYKAIHNNRFYWSEIHSQKLTTYNKQPQHYMEFFGHAFMAPKKVQSIWKYGFMIPKEVRRTKEANAIKEIPSNQKYIERTGILEVSVYNGHGLFWYLKVFEQIYPLDKKHGRYTIKLVDEEFIDGQEYYVFDYKRSSRFVVGTRAFLNIYGTFWVNKENFDLKKITMNYDFESMNTLSLNVDYILKDNRLYFSKIQGNEFYYPKRSVDRKDKVISSYSLNYTNINTQERDNYLKSAGDLQSFCCEKFLYHADFWKNYPLSENKYLEEISMLKGNRSIDELFTEGANTPVYDTNHSSIKTLYKYKEKTWKNGLKLLQSDLKLSK